MSSSSGHNSSKAPYYYGELIKKESSNLSASSTTTTTAAAFAASVAAVANSSGISTSSSSSATASSSNGNGGSSSSGGVVLGANNTECTPSVAVTAAAAKSLSCGNSIHNGNDDSAILVVDNHQQTVVDHTELSSPSTSSTLLKRIPPQVPPHLNHNHHQQQQHHQIYQSHYGLVGNPRAYQPHNTIGSFANPLLSIEPDTRNGTESLPRVFQTHGKKFFNSNTTKNPKQGIYQRSLSIFANGVSPLLRKKKSSKHDPKSLNDHTESSLAHLQALSSSTLGLVRSRRKSEPIMFSYDSITNELSKFQAREEKIVENINLDLEKMLMNDTNGGGGGGTGVGGDSQYGMSGMKHSMHPNDPNASSSSFRQLKLANMQYYGRKDTSDPYGRTIHGSMQNSQPQLSYKEPFYMVYEDNRVKHNDDNIYEEIDFLTLSSLRAQYADTLSLQSYKKKGGSKRSLASSSFTRWFSTRKKNSPSMSEDENPYIDIKISKKQRPPITLPEAPKDLTKEQLKRRYIVGSIVDSENSYINSLQRIINCYKKPLEDNSPTILSQNKINIIFHRLEQILQCHTIFGIALSQCVREWDEKEQIGDVFIASFSKSMVLDIYSDFINNFTNAMETARKATKSKSAFAQFLQEKSLSSPDRLSFFGLMVKPVQRFPQFILLLSDLLKHTPSDHHDRMSLQLALTQLESLADRLNERKRDAERHFAVKQLLKDYLSTSTTSSSHRFLLRQDDVYQLDLDTSSGLVMKTKCRKLYLLNDMLVCVSVPANRLKFAVSLQDVDVMDDVTPATNNLIANSMLKSKDSASNSSSPKHCTVERMYLDLNGLIHDLEVFSRITNLISSLRYQYNGISMELSEQISAEIREEIRRKDAQITLIDRSCLQIRIRSKNYKDIICIQLNDPEVKKDWLTDVRLAKLALDRSNNPAWDIVNESLSTSRTNLSNSIIMHRVPLFVKSLPIFATTEHSQLTCALHYKLNRRDDLVFENDAGVLWICNVNENGSQLGALATNGAEISLIHSFELCDSHVTSIESVGTYAVWIGLRQGRIIVIDASSPGEWQQFASLEVSAEVTCIRHFGNFVYVGLISGHVTLFNATHYEEPIVITLSGTHPVTCLLAVNKEMFACSGDKIWIIQDTQLNRSYSLANNNGKINMENETMAIGHSFADEELRPNLLAHCGIGLWVSLINSPIIKLYHTETFKHLQDVNVSSNVKRILGDMVDPSGIFVTAMLATRGLLWIGTNVGVIVTLNLPRLQGVPLISGCLNVALHRHTGPVTILLNLTTSSHDVPMHPNNAISTTKDQDGKPNEGNVNNEIKNEDVESIYGLYSDLMNVENYVRSGQESRQSHITSKMAWDLANMNLSDDSTSESAIYQDGSIIRKRQMVSLQRKNVVEQLAAAAGQSTNVYPGHLSPAKSQSSIYDSSGIQTIGDKCQDKENVSSSSGFGASSSLYDIAPFRSNKLIHDGTSTSMSIVNNNNIGRQYDSSNSNNINNGGNLNNCGASNKTALLMTGGNGYKRVTVTDTPYSSQHAHCCVWEYKL